MFIRKIILDNYRIYFGENAVEFSQQPGKNVFIMSGENGSGKTTFLTSLVWCLYGKLMAEVDEKYKREIYEAGGYKRYASNSLNRLANSELKSEYSVSMVLSGISIPSLPCQEVTIKRTFNLNKGDDNVRILIDDQPNELTKEVGSEIFINDFVLPKEVAKFFFFDAEKIVALAEMKSIEDKRKLSTAYSEVLGIKKYEDLKSNLNELRIRLRRSAATKNDKVKFEKLQKESDDLQRVIQFNNEQILNLSEEKASKRQQSERYQEKLIREGDSLSVEELIELKKMRDKLSERGKQIRAQAKDLLDLAPFAIAGTKLIETREQVYKETENSLNAIDPTLLREKIKNIKSYLIKKELQDLNPQKTKTILKAIERYVSLEFLPGKEKGFKVLLQMSATERNEFEAIYNNLRFSYSQTFRQLIQEEKNNRITLNKLVRKISDAETKGNDILVKEIRQQKATLDERIRQIEERIANLNQEIGGIQREVAVVSRKSSELSKKIELEKNDKEKDETAQRLIEHLEKFTSKLKLEKKASLEQRIKEELNGLMHKKGFIHRVEVEVSIDITEIHLFDDEEKLIQKESLSKGEQQLYATSILKALVDESNIKFPIFIDSPLQKFDKRHSRNIICEFYPTISEQVVLFPLLEKELTELEFKQLMGHINSTFLIQNIGQYSSKFERIGPKKLFKAYKENEHLHTH